MHVSGCFGFELVFFSIDFKGNSARSWASSLGILLETITLAVFLFFVRHTGTLFFDIFVSGCLIELERVRYKVDVVEIAGSGVNILSGVDSGLLAGLWMVQLLHGPGKKGGFCSAEFRFGLVAIAGVYSAIPIPKGASKRLDMLFFHTNSAMKQPRW